MLLVLMGTGLVGWIEMVSEELKTRMVNQLSPVSGTEAETWIRGMMDDDDVLIAEAEKYVMEGRQSWGHEPIIICLLDLIEREREAKRTYQEE